MSAIVVGPVGEKQRQRRQSGSLRRSFNDSIRLAEDNQLRIDPGDGLHHLQRQRIVTVNHIAHCRVKTQVNYPGTLGAGNGRERAKLIYHLLADLIGRERHLFAPEALAIRQTGVGSNPHAAHFRQAYHPRHDRRIPRVKTAGDVGRRDLIH